MEHYIRLESGETSKRFQRLSLHCCWKLDSNEVKLNCTLNTYCSCVIDVNITVFSATAITTETNSSTTFSMKTLNQFIRHQILYKFQKRTSNSSEVNVITGFVSGMFTSGDEMRTRLY